MDPGRQVGESFGSSGPNRVGGRRQKNDGRDSPQAGSPASDGEQVGRTVDLRIWGFRVCRSAPRPGARRRYGAETEKRILKMLDQPPPDGFASWNGDLLAKALADVLLTIRSGGFCAAKASLCSAGRAGASAPDPQFAPKAADIVGLYLAPPENAVVLSVYERKISIQALERAQGYLQLPKEQGAHRL